KTPEQAVTEFYEKRKDRIFFVKHGDWQDEAEYRWVFYDPQLPMDPMDPSDHRGAFVSVTGCVAALVLGGDYSDAHIAVAREFLRSVDGGGNVVRCHWDRLHLRLRPFGEVGGAWVECSSNEAVSLNLTVKVGPASSP